MTKRINNALTIEGDRLWCERCGRQIRRVAWAPSGYYGQDWDAAEIDPDICTACEDDVIAACDAYNNEPAPAGAA